MEVIRTENLIRTYKDGTMETNVLKGINLTINNHEFISITGASGTGKSTLIYHLGLLDEASDGKVYVGGIDQSTMSVEQKTAYRLDNFGFVFQDYALLPEMNAWENVALPILMRGTSIREAKAKASESLEKLGLEGRLNHFPSQLSGGESQRVSVARAIVHNPSVLFADEPTANLDSNRSRQIINIFHELHKAGQTIIMVTHELEYANETERLLVLDDGVISDDKKLK